MSKAKKIIQMFEMAKLGTKDGYQFYIYSEPLLQKSIHIKWGQNEIVFDVKNRIVLEVKKLEKNKFKNLIKGNPLPTKLQKLVDEFLQEKNAKAPWMTNRKALDFLWSALNEDF